MTKNAIAGNKTLAKHWNGRRYSDDSKKPSFSAPSSLAASASGTTITITWTDNTGGVASTVIERSIDAGTTWAALATVAAGTNSYANSGLSAGTYYYRARALIGSTHSGYTSTASATIAGSWQLSSGHFIPAKIAMEIIAPRAGLTTANRYYKAYPGLEYRVPVSVLGGAWPFKYELTSAPSGMTIGGTYGSTDYGIIVWSNPTTSGSPHTVSVKVTDQEGTIQTVTYTLTVTTSGFIFIDPVGGNNSNAGTLASPKQTMTGLSSSYGDFIYFRAGTTAAVQPNARTYLGYPGETAILDFTGGPFFHVDAVNMCFSGLTIKPKDSSSGGPCVAHWDSGATDILIFENTVQQVTGSEVAGGNNSLFMSRNGYPSYTTRFSFIGNTIAGAEYTDIFLAYFVRKAVFQKNTISNQIYNGIYFKNDYQYVSVRENTGLSGNTRELVNFSDYATADSVELCYNNYKTSGDALAFFMGNSAGASNIWSYRNTWQAARHYVNIAPINPLTVDSDVMQYTDATANAHGWKLDYGATVTATYSGEECVGRGTTFVDSSGALTGTYRTNYLGTRGREVA